MRTKLLSILTLIFPFLIFAQETTEEIGMDQKIDQAFAPISDFFSNIIFFPIYQSDTVTIPFVL